MRGLYLITNDDPLELLLAKLEGAMATREVAILQYRRKKVPKEEQAYEVEYMKAMCAEYRVPFVINDDLEMAVKYGVGVHLGQGDGEVAEVHRSECDGGDRIHNFDLFEANDVSHCEGADSQCCRPKEVPVDCKAEP